MLFIFKVIELNIFINIALKAFIIFLVFFKIELIFFYIK